MTTRVVNVHHHELYDQYIGRVGHGQDGYFGNPFAVHQAAGDRDQCLEKYRNYFLGRVTMDPEFRRKVEALRGKTLGCFCAPAGGLTAADQPFRCHGQVIAEYVDGLPG